mmetsp:Transcript_15668/g.46260  ORF Transcript_15668/g.46260 Transcript_15668/m.46260 type:complete len:230 (-) Transcript_15668:2609-3298(-)
MINVCCCAFCATVHVQPADLPSTPFRPKWWSLGPSCNLGHSHSYRRQTPWHKQRRSYMEVSPGNDQIPSQRGLHDAVVSSQVHALPVHAGSCGTPATPEMLCLPMRSNWLSAHDGGMLSRPCDSQQGSPGLMGMRMGDPKPRLSSERLSNPSPTCSSSVGSGIGCADARAGTIRANVVGGALAGRAGMPDIAVSSPTAPPTSPPATSIIPLPITPMLTPMLTVGPTSSC